MLLTKNRTEITLCNGQEIVPVDTLVVTALVVVADPASVDHVPASRIGFWVEQVVTFGTEVERCLFMKIFTQPD